MKRTIIIIVFTLIFALHNSFAQSQVKTDISGKVINQESRGIDGASIYLMSADQQVILKTSVSDLDGTYTFSQVDTGRYYLEITAVGYEISKTDVFDFHGNKVDIPAITLTTSSETIETVTVRRQLPMIQSTEGKLILNVENSTLAAGSNALEVLQRAPGVTIDKDENIQLMGRSGINVTIDGRQTFMSGEQLATFLKSLDASQVKSIEVGSTRSAKEDAEGAAGSINIVLKKNRVEGFNGNAQLSAAHGYHPRGNGSLSLNYKKNNTTLFGSYAYTNNKKEFDLEILRIIGGDTGTEFDQVSDMLETDKTHNYRVGIEHKTSERNTLLLQFSANNNTEDSKLSSFTEMKRPNMAIDSTLITSTMGINKFNRYSLNFNNEYQLDTLGGKLILDADITRFRNKGHVNYEYDMRDKDNSPLYPIELERSRTPSNIDIYVAKIDYVKPFSNGHKIESGVKYSNVRSDNDLQFEHYVNDNWQDYEGRPNHFIYTEQIAAAYVDYSKNLDKWSLKAGLRGEYTISDGNSITIDETVSREYFDLFPSVNIGYNASENHVFNLGYAKKITRPSYRHLNPFEYYIDRFTYMKGNEHLQPQYTHGLTLTYTLMKMFNFTLGSDITNNAMTEGMGQDEETKKSWIIQENLGKNITSYLNINTPYRIGNFWTFNNNMTLVHMYFKGPMSGIYIDQGGFMFQLNNMNNFKINNRLSAETSIAYTTPFIYSIYKLERRLGIDAGVNYTFKGDRSTLKLAVTDIFKTNTNNLSTRFDVFHSDIRQYNDSRAVRLTYSFRFGNLKQNIRRNDSNNEERERAAQ